MAQPVNTLYHELSPEVAQRVELDLGTPMREFVIESSGRYLVRFFLLFFGLMGAIFFIIFVLTLKTQQSMVLAGLVLVAFVGAWLIYFSAPFKRYGKQHMIHIYICSKGLLGVRGGRILYHTGWAYVQTIDYQSYGKAGMMCKLRLIDGREIMLKHTYQPVPSGGTNKLASAIEHALANYRSQGLG